MPVGIDGYVKLLLHGEGTNNGTTFTDSSSLNKSPSVVENTCTKTDQYKFGGSSIYFDTTGDMLYYTPDYSFDMADGRAMTIDLWARFATLPTSGNTATLSAQATWGSNEAWYFFVANSSGTYYLIIQKAGSSIVSTAITIATGEWHHFAVSKSTSNYFYTFYDGALIGTPATATGFNKYQTLRIGNFQTGGTSYQFNGWIDEYRFSSDICRWTTSFGLPVDIYRSAPTHTRDIRYLSYRGHDRHSRTGISLGV